MNRNSLVQNAIVGTVVALAAVVVTFFIADAVSGPLMATDPAGAVTEVPLPGAIIGTVIGGIVGALLALGVRNLDRSVEAFLGVCLIGLVLYGIYAFVQAEGFAAGLWLNVMHIAAAVPIVGILTRWLQARTPQPATV
jgi:hypothetical protein